MTKFAQAAFVLFTLVAVAAAASDSSSDDHREVFAVPVPKVSSSKSKESSKGGKKQAGNKGTGMRRFPMPVRTTLTGVDFEDDSMTADECIFVEDTWMTAFQTVHGDDEDSLTARAFIVEQDDGNKQRNPNRKLRGDSSSKNNNRSLFSWNLSGFTPPSVPSFSGFTPGPWFDIWAVFEPSCNLCGYDDDRRLTAADSDVNRRFEMLFCDMLREGPFERFQDVQECQVTFA
jgi:hypothetical protein